MSRDDLDAVLAGIDGALADADLPDAMRWAPDPAGVTDAGPAPYDGSIVPQPPQQYESTELVEAARTWPPAPAVVRVHLVIDDDALTLARAGGIGLLRQRVAHRYDEELLIVEVDRERAEVALAAAAELWQRVIEGLRPAVEAIGKAMGDAAASLRGSALLPERPPVDPRARALWARDNRSTGPVRMAQHERRPRRHQ